LEGEGDADGGAGAEEVAEGAGGYAELFDAGDGRGLRAGRVETESGGVVEAVDGSGQRGNVAYVVVAGILAVQEIEEFCEGAELKTFRTFPVSAQSDVAADAEINLIERSPAELIQRGLHAIDYGAVVAGEAVVQNVGGSGDGEGARAFELRERGEFAMPGKLERSDQDEAVANIFTGRAVIARAESVERIRNSIDVIEEFADDGSPAGGAGKNVIGGEFEAI